MIFMTTDLCDQYESDIHAGQIHVLPPVFTHYGGSRHFSGQAVTLKVFEDNSIIKNLLENQNGGGKVLVIDGGASVRCALVGGNLAAAAVKNGWAGIIVDGAVRDVHEIKQLSIGVLALALHPLRAVKRNVGLVDLPIQVQQIRVHPNDWIYADEDGCLVSPKSLLG